MINIYYLYDLEKWELKIYAENPKNDKRIDLFDNREEAEKALCNFEC